MALLAAAFGMLGRFTGKILTMSLGWASTLLFGRVSRDRQIFLAAISFGAVIWAVALVGVALPAVGAFLLAFMPIPPWVNDNWVRLAMLAVVIALPPALGGVTLKLLRPKDRPVGVAGVAGQLARGYPLAAGLSAMLVFLAIIGVVRKGASLARRWTDAHIPVVLKPGGYERLAADMDTAITDSGIDVDARDAPAVLVVPAHILAAIAGPRVRALLPERLVRLVGNDLEVLIYPTDISIGGKAAVVSRVQAALASRLTTADVWLTMTAEAQSIEDSLGRLASDRPDGPDRAAALASIDHRLATTNLPYDEWEVVYRQRLQVERDLLAGIRPGEKMPVASGGSRDVDQATGLRGVRRYLRRESVATIFAAAAVVLATANAVLLVAERVGTRLRFGRSRS